MIVQQSHEKALKYCTLYLLKYAVQRVLNIWLVVKKNRAREFSDTLKTYFMRNPYN